MILMYLLVRLCRQSQRYQHHYRMSKPLILYDIIVAVTVSSEKAICEHYLPHLSSVYRINYLGKMLKYECCLVIFCTYFFNNLTNLQDLRSCGSISLKTVLIFLDFRSDMIEKQDIIIFCSYSPASQSYPKIFRSRRFCSSL